MFHSDINNTKPTNELQTLNQNQTQNDNKPSEPEKYDRKLFQFRTKYLLIFPES